MTDFVTLPGTGEDIAADEIAGLKHQRIKVQYGENGSATDVSLTNPMPINAVGELIEAVEAMRMAIHSLTRSIGQSTPDTVGRLRVNVGDGTLTSLATLATLTNQLQVGGNPAFEQIPALMRLGADSLRRNVSVT